MEANKKRLINDPSPRISNSNLIEDLENEKMTKTKKRNPKKLSKRILLLWNWKRKTQMTKRNLHVQIPFLLILTSFLSIASPVLSYPKLVNIPESTNHSVASSITRSLILPTIQRSCQMIISMPNIQKQVYLIFSIIYFF